MSTKLKRNILVMFLSIFTLTLFVPQQAEAGSYYYDKSSGNYVVNVTGASYKGRDLKKSLPGSVARKLKDAATKKYGTLKDNTTYYFNYKNIVRPYGKYGGSSWTGKVTGVVCTGRR